MKKFLYCLITFLIFVVPVTVEAAFSSSEIYRVEEAKRLLSDAETRFVDSVIRELETAGSPQGQLALYEAIARTFDDMVRELRVETPESRSRLLKRIKLNMAYFQLGGASAKDRLSGSELDMFIQQTLIQYLDEDIWNNPELFHTLKY